MWTLHCLPKNTVSLILLSRGKIGCQDLWFIVSVHTPPPPKCQTATAPSPDCQWVPENISNCVAKDCVDSYYFVYSPKFFVSYSFSTRVLM